MNKTVTVNIGGLVFHIEEHAYEKLNRYLEAIRGYFTTSEGRDEIMQDIESRIAEMLTQRIKDSKQVIVETDVEYVINVLGRPEQFVEGSEDENRTYAAHIEEKRSYRKLYRDVDDKVVSGVCAGIAHRMGIDPIWIRIIYIVFTLATAFFTGLIVYLILAAIIPAATATAQKLEMKGESVTVGTIRRAVEEQSPRPDSAARRFFDTLGEILKGAFKIVLYMVGALFALLGILMLFGLFFLLLASLGVAGISIPLYVSDLFLTPGQQFWAVLSVILLLGIPVILLLYLGLKILFNIKKTGRVFKVSALALWLFGLLIALWLAFDVGSDFSESARVRNDLPVLAANTDTLFIGLMKDGLYDEEDWNGHWRMGRFFGHRMTITTGDETRVVPDNVRLDIQRANGDRFELIQFRSAYGPTLKEANEGANGIQYNLVQRDSLIEFSDHFPLPEGTRFRDQRVKLILKVPVGKSVHLNPGSERVIYDIDNVTHTYDGDMIGHTWTMTEKGLSCLSGDFDDDNAWRGNGDAHVRIDDSGIHIKAREGDDSLNYKAKDVDIRIDDRGVIIDANQ